MRNRGRKKTRADTSRDASKSTMAYLFSNDISDILLPEGYLPLSKNEQIIRCANILADMVSSMTIMLMENGENGDKRVKNELSKMIDVTPCRFMDRKNFIFKIVRDMVMTGNSVVYPIVGENGWISELVTWEADSVSFRGNETGYKIIYKGNEYAHDEVLHFVLVPDSGEPWRGEGYKKAIISSVKTLVQAKATKKGFLESKWKPSMIISVQADIEEMKDKAFRKNILGSYTDTTEEGEPWLIPTGEIDVKTVQPLSLKDLAVQESIELDVKEIACAIGIPPFLVGAGTFDVDEFNGFIATKVMAFAEIIQQQMTRKLLLNPKWYFKMNPKSLMQYKLAEQFSFVSGMVKTGMMSRNQGRAEFDYSPADTDGMNEYNVLENFIPVGMIGQQKKLVGIGGGENGTE